MHCSIIMFQFTQLDEADSEGDVGLTLYQTDLQGGNIRRQQFRLTDIKTYEGSISSNIMAQSMASNSSQRIRLRFSYLMLVEYEYIIGKILAKITNSSPIRFSNFTRTYHFDDAITVQLDVLDWPNWLKKKDVQPSAQIIVKRIHDALSGGNLTFAILGQRESLIKVSELFFQIFLKQKS